jgi:hypothetical protein
MSGMAQISVSLATWKAIEAQRLSFGEDHDAIIRRALAARKERKLHLVQTMSKAAIPVTRRRGDMSVTVAGRTEPVANLKAAYITILTMLVKRRPSLFQSLLSEGSQRRRWIAIKAEELFPLSPHLAAQHAHQIAPNWYIDTNLSKAQIEARLSRAAELAGLTFGADIVITGG